MWLTANFFWIFPLAIVLAVILSLAIRNYQRERTIRAAIEKGGSLDPTVLGALTTNSASPGNARAGLMTGAIVTFFVGCGLMTMAFFLGLERAQPLYALYGVGSLIWCIAAGLYVARLAIKQ